MPESTASRPQSSASSATSSRLLRPGVVNSANGEFDIRDHYFKLLQDDPSKSMPIAAIESLSALCDANQAKTIHELMDAITEGANALKRSIPNAISLTAGCDLFKRFIFSHAHDDPENFERFKEQLQANGHLFAQRAREARAKVADIGRKAIRDGATVFLHGHSRCVMALMETVIDSGVRFRVIVGETRPSKLGIQTAEELRKRGVEVALIDDAAVGYAMKMATIVIMGAEGVFGDGSFLNIMGSLPVALAAKQFNKPFYVTTETHKFVDILPLDQYNMPVKQNIVDFNTNAIEPSTHINGRQAFVDHIPAALVKGFITEVGLLTPQQVAERIIQMRFE